MTAARCTRREAPKRLASTTTPGRLPSAQIGGPGTLLFRPVSSDPRPTTMSFNDNDRLTVLLDDLTHEIKRLNENLEQLDNEREEVVIGADRR